MAAQLVLGLLACPGLGRAELSQLLLRLVHQLDDRLPGLLVGLPLGHAAGYGDISASSYSGLPISVTSVTFSQTLSFPGVQSFWHLYIYIVSYTTHSNGSV